MEEFQPRDIRVLIKKYFWISQKHVATNTERWKEAHLDFTWVEGVKVWRHIQLLVLHYNFYTMLPHLKEKGSLYWKKMDTGTKLVENSQVKLPSWFKRIVSGQDFSSGPASDTLSQKIFYRSWNSTYNNLNIVKEIWKKRPRSILFHTQLRNCQGRGNNSKSHKLIFE